MKNEGIKPPTGDDPREWEAYLEASGHGMERGKPIGKKYEGFGLSVKSERAERREDTDKWHSNSCPLNMKPTYSPYSQQVNMPGDRPTEDEAFPDPD